MKLQIKSIKSSDFYSTHNHCHNSETFGCQKAFAGFVFAVVGIDSRVKHMMVKHHASELHLNPKIQLENTFITTRKHYRRLSLNLLIPSFAQPLAILHVMNLQICQYMFHISSIINTYVWLPYCQILPIICIVLVSSSIHFVNKHRFCTWVCIYEKCYDQH